MERNVTNGNPGACVNASHDVNYLNGDYTNASFERKGEFDMEIRQQMTREERALHHGKEFVVQHCKDCGHEYLMGREEMEWFWDRDLVLPHRCPVCRSRRKAARKAYRDCMRGYAAPSPVRRPYRREVNIHG